MQEAAESKVVSLGLATWVIPGTLSRSSVGNGTRTKAKLKRTAEPVVRSVDKGKQIPLSLSLATSRRELG